MILLPTAPGIEADGPPPIASDDIRSSITSSLCPPEKSDLGDESARTHSIAPTRSLLRELDETTQFPAPFGTAIAGMPTVAELRQGKRRSISIILHVVAGAHDCFIWGQ